MRQRGHAAAYRPLLNLGRTINRPHR